MSETPIDLPAETPGRDRAAALLREARGALFAERPFSGADTVIVALALAVAFDGVPTMVHRSPARWADVRALAIGLVAR